MRIVKTISLLLASAALALLAGCGGADGGNPADPPADFRVIPGDGSAIITWTPEPDVEYWLFYGVGPDISTSNWAPRGGVALTNVTPPRIVTGLVNGQTYSFTINGRKNRGPGGPGAPTQNIVPQLAGANWAPGAPLGTQNLNGLSAGGLPSGFSVVAVGDAGVIFTSLNAGPFVARTNPLNLNLYGSVYGLGGFVAVGENGTILLSPNGSDWTQQTSGTTARLHGGVSNTGAQYVVVGAGGTIVTSGGGSSWTTPGSGTTEDLYAAAWGNNRFVAVGANGTVLYGSSGDDWFPGPVLTDRTLRGAAFGAILASGTQVATNVYVAVGDGGAVLTSPDAETWSLLPAFTTVNLRSVVFGGRFVAVGEDGSIFTSTDGQTWESRVSNTGADLNAVARTLSGYTAVGQAGANVSTVQ
jgi:hypothetical protein